MNRTENSDKSRENIFLIGFMGCGKSTVADFLVRKYGMQRIEMDQQIEKEEGMTIAQIFAEKGESYFRELETALLKKLQTQKNTVVSCGGGTAMREENVQIMKAQGKIVLLLAEPETIYNRVKNSHNRPLLEGNMNVPYIQQLLEARMPKYEAAADVCVHTDGKSMTKICEEVLKK